MIKRLPLAALTFCATISAAAAATPLPVEGPVVLARTGAQDTYLWDASPYVSDLVKQQNLGDGGMRALEATAIAILASKATNSHADRLLVSVVYTKAGSVSPAYGVLAFHGVEKVCALSAARADLLKNGDAWAQQAADGHLPAKVKLDVTGELPPPQ